MLLDPYILHNATVILPATFLILIYPRSAPNLGISCPIWGQTLEILKKIFSFVIRFQPLEYFLEQQSCPSCICACADTKHAAIEEPGGMIILCFSANTLVPDSLSLPFFAHNCLHNTAPTYFISYNFPRVCQSCCCPKSKSVRLAVTISGSSPVPPPCWICNPDRNDANFGTHLLRFYPVTQPLNNPEHWVWSLTAHCGVARAGLAVAGLQELARGGCVRPNMAPADCQGHRCCHQPLYCSAASRPPRAAAAPPPARDSPASRGRYCGPRAGLQCDIKAWG